jgi:putative membrane protein
MMFWYGNHPGVGWSIVMTLVMLVFWGGIAAFMVYALRGALSGRSPNGAKPDPKQILADRFAQGEIDEDEYRSRLKVLGGSS